MPDTATRRLTVGQPPQHSPPTTTDGIPAGKKSRTTSPLPMDQENITKLPMPLVLEKGGNGDGDFVEDMDIEDDAETTRSFLKAGESSVPTESFGPNSFHTPPTSPHRAPHETASDGFFDQLSPIQRENREDRSSSLECEASFSVITHEEREGSFENISSPGSSSDAEKTIHAQPSSSSDSENGFVMVDNVDPESIPLLPKTSVSNDTLANLTNLSVNSPVPLVRADSEPLSKEKPAAETSDDSQDVGLQMRGITLKHEDFETEVKLSFTLSDVKWMEFSCSPRFLYLRFKSDCKFLFSSPGYYEQFAGKDVSVDENTIFRFDAKELWRDVLPVDPCAVKTSDGSTFEITLIKAVHCREKWPHLFLSDFFGEETDTVPDFGVFPETPGEILVKPKFLTYDWNEDPEDKQQRVYVYFRIRNASFIDVQCTSQRFLLRFRTSEQKFLLQNTVKPSGKFVTPTEKDIFRYESEPLYAPIESVARVPQEKGAPKSAADESIQIVLLKRTRAYWQNLYLNSPTEAVKRNVHLDGSPPKASFSNSYVPPAVYSAQEEAVSSTTGYYSDAEEDGENISTMFKQNGDSQGWQQQSRSGYGRQNGRNSGSGRSLYRYESSDDLSNSNPYSSQVTVKQYYGKTGLDNLGNSCYLNAVVQCLANTRELRDYFIGGRYKKEINTQNPLGSKGKFAKVMQETLKALWSGSMANYSPYPLRKVMADSNEQFSTKGQQDAQEAMACIIEALHEDLNRVTKKPYKEDIESDGKSDEAIAKETWDYYLSREDSAIHDLFTGMFKSTVECKKCAKQNIKFDAYQCVSVPVPRHGIVVECKFYPHDVQKPIKKFRVALNKDHKFNQDQKLLQAHMGDVPLVNTEILILTKPSDSSDFYHADMSKPHDFACSKLDEGARFLIFEVLRKETANEPVHNYVVKQFTRVSRDPPPFRTKCDAAGCFKRLEASERKRCTKCWAVSYCSKECQGKHWAIHRNECNHAHGPAVGLPFIVSLRESQLKKTNFFIHAAKTALKSVTVLKSVKPQSRPTSTASESPAPSEPSSSSSAEPQSPSPMDTTMTEQSQPTSPSPHRTGTPNDTFSDCDSGVGSSLSVNNETELVEWDMAATLKKMMTSNGSTLSFPFALLPEVGKDEGKVGSGTMPSWKEEMDNDEKAMENLRKKKVFNLVWNNTPNATPLRIEDKVLDSEEDESCHSLKNGRERHCSGSRDEFTLNDCVKMLTEPEVLDQSNAWMCPACKKPQEAEKKFEIWSLPTVLVFQLKRFSKPSGEVWRRDKIESYVDIPEELDMSQSIVGPADGGPYIYDLYGVVNHRGSTWFGHYVAYTRCYQVPDTQNDEVEWRSFDDEFVQPETKLDGISSSAYLLFYRRRGTPNPIHLSASSGDESSDGDSDDPPQGALLETSLSPKAFISYLTSYCTMF